MGEETTVLWADNIQFLAKNKGLKLSDISKELDIPTSFYSRARKGDTAANAYTLDKIAGYLGVTIDALLHFDFAGMSENELLVVNFIQKILRQTNEGDIVWQRERAADFMGKWSEGHYKNVHHPLFEVEPGFESVLAAMTLGREEVNYVYCSSFHMVGAKIRIAGDCFNAPLGNKSWLYLMNVVVDGKSTSLPPEYELYIVTDGDAKPVCCTISDNEGSINDNLRMLRKAADDSSMHLRLTRGVKNFLEAYVTPKEEKDKKGHLPTIAT